jgi:endonuclease/exonuclease/phosphatase family metal-dependent hydrolase
LLSSIPRALAILLASLSLSCAHAINYLDPSGPSYVYPRAAETVPPVPPASPLRVVTFNIEYGIQVDRAIQVLREAEPLRNPDILSLQEMDAPGTERIAKALGLNAVYFPSGVHPKHRRDFGCALLSPWPLDHPRKVVLPHGARGSGLRRSAVTAVVLRGEQRVTAYCVHLPSPLAVSGGSRAEELRVLAADANRAPEPVVIAGDFNSHDKVGELAKAGFTWVTKDVGATARFHLFGIPLAGLSYDHVLVKGLRPSGEPGAVGVIEDNRGASDHNPVWSVLR